MSTDKNKIEEPYRPESTPTPPQEIDPSMRKDHHKQEDPTRPVSDARKEDRDRQPQGDEHKEKLPGESEAEIEDETTI